MTEPVLIEQTAKRWKRLQLIGVVTCLFGLLLMFTPVRGVGIGLAIIGLGVLGHVRYKTWWHHR
jgi:uncharacterized membrane protein HdeD (DUF308 family)